MSRSHEPRGGRDGSFKGFVFRGDQVREGDVLLCTIPDDRISKLIRRITGGTFSHTAICTFRPNFTEADGPGVSEFSLDRFGLMHRGAVRFLRLKNSIKRSGEIARSAALHAYRYCTQDYSTIAAAASVIPGWNVTPKSRAFCSYLVAAAYDVAGLNLTVERKLPQKTTPADIERSPHFDDITENIVVEIFFDEIEGVDFLDRNNPTSPTQRINIARREVVKKVAAYLKVRGLPCPNTYQEAQESFFRHIHEPWFREFDATFADAFRQLIRPQVADILADAQQPTLRETITGILNSEPVSEPDFRGLFNFITHRIATTQRLIADRQSDVLSLRNLTSRTDWQTVREWFLESTAVLVGLFANLEEYEKISDLMYSFAECRGWRIP